MYFLIDCNNFYASCEQLFTPAYRDRPLVVLSNNDGCVVARSKEAKALGIPMGAPVYQWREHFLHHNVISLSSNFPLYADMSQRVIATLETFSLPIEVYSIDECFLECQDIALAEKIRKQVYQWTGIPTSIGIGPTKTLAKLANRIAKDHHCGTHIFQSIPKDFPVEEIWGIGRRMKKTLYSYGVTTAKQFCNLDETWVKKKLSVAGLRTLLELKGIACRTENEMYISAKSILSSRSFTKPLTTYRDVSESLSTFVAKASQKLRRKQLQTNFITIFISTNRFKKESFYSNSCSCRLPLATSFTPTLIEYAKKMLKEIYRDGDEYKRAGVLLTELSGAHEKQLDLLAQNPSTEKEKRAMEALDQINRRYGTRLLYYGAEKRTASAHINRSFTTSWEQLPKIYL
ncbi:MAG: DUF4113 domain-containing protein [Candidatus Algichlamydia australiensis]|nr:DUF4113 domain-containing protein [Chlamydiales bacterium]